jgi:hypothetical protein
MISNPKLVISVSGKEDQDPSQLRRLVSSLQKNLASSGIQSESANEAPEPSDSSVEYRSASASLYSLAISFITSGAAITLINALQASAASARGAAVKFTLDINGRKIDVDASHLNDQAVGNLTDVLHKELEKN